MLYPDRLAYDVFRFGNAVAHLTRGITGVLPDAPDYGACDNAKARSMYGILKSASEQGINLAEIILAQIKEYKDAEAINDIGCSGSTAASDTVRRA